MQRNLREDDWQHIPPKEETTIQRAIQGVLAPSAEGPPLMNKSIKTLQKNAARTTAANLARRMTTMAQMAGEETRRPTETHALSTPTRAWPVRPGEMAQAIESALARPLGMLAASLEQQSSQQLMQFMQHQTQKFTQTLNQRLLYINYVTHTCVRVFTIGP